MRALLHPARWHDTTPQTENPAWAIRPDDRISGAEAR
jgi:hypothetical protein